MKKEVLNVIEEFNKNPKKYDGTLVKDLVLEMKGLMSKEEKLANELEEIQRESLGKMKLAHENFIKNKGSMQAIENLILRQNIAEMTDKH